MGSEHSRVWYRFVEAYFSKELGFVLLNGLEDFFSHYHERVVENLQHCRCIVSKTVHHIMATWNAPKDPPSPRGGGEGEALSSQLGTDACVVGGEIDL